MKLPIKFIIFGVVALLLNAGSAFGQFSRDFQYFTHPDQRGLNQFEAPFHTDVEFDGIDYG